MSIAPIFNLKQSFIVEDWKLVFLMRSATILILKKYTS